MVATMAGRSELRFGVVALVVTALAVSSTLASMAAATLVASPAGATAKPAAVGSTIKVDKPTKYGVSPGFVGLTFEATSLGSAYFDPNQSNLPTYLDELGSGDLRIGGQTSDLNVAWLPSASDPLPSWASNGATPADLDAVGSLVHQTDWSVDLGVNLLHFDPALAANEVQAARTALGSSLHGVEIGNEPDLYFYFLSFINEPPADVPTTFPGYLTNWNAYVSAIDQTSPGVAFAGPDFYLTSWLPDETKKTEKGLSAYTQHFYPLEDCGGAVISPEQLLSPSSYASEDSLIASALKASKKGKLPLVLDEFNSISCGSSSPATYEFASSLWAVHALLDAASDGVSSVNIQMDPGNCDSYSPLCVPDPSSPGTLAPTPIFYAMQLVSSLEGGTLVKTTIKTTALPAGVSEEAVRLANGNVAVVVDNTTASPAGPLSVQLDSTARLLSTEQLAAPSLTATSGVTLTTTTAGNPSPTGLVVPAYTADVFTVAP
jgi:hypothetical protein